MNDPSDLPTLFAVIVRDGRLPAGLWPADADPERYGLVLRDGHVQPPQPLEPLVGESILAAADAATASWVRRLDVYPAIDSTNAQLMQRATGGSIDGHVSLAEVQLQGRGRRGRTWSSPFGGSIAVSMGIALDRDPAALGGSSLVVGLAVLDALEQLGAQDAGLKWPNDLLLGDAKLGGILIELAAAARSSALVVGIGINVALGARVRSELDRPVADLSAFGPPSRNLLAGRVLSSVVAFLRAFEADGFSAFRDAFCARHRYHGRACRVLLGERTASGRVVGVSNDGGLLLETQGRVEEFHGGEVSLREDAAGGP